MVAGLHPDTLFKKDSDAVAFLRLFIDINIFFTEQLQVTAPKCHFGGSTQSSLWTKDFLEEVFSIHDGGRTHDLIQKKRTRCLAQMFMGVFSVDLSLQFIKACFFHIVFTV